ncbi:LOW QUALITY PROTEIN: hypothetical protein PanWU01x14_149240, partial [Parasponia andersonii]
NKSVDKSRKFHFLPWSLKCCCISLILGLYLSVHLLFLSICESLLFQALLVSNTPCRANP